MAFPRAVPYFSYENYQEHDKKDLKIWICRVVALLAARPVVLLLFAEIVNPAQGC